MALACPLQRGAPEAERIHAMMRIKTVVLISNEHRDETGIHIGCRDGKPPAAIRRREGPKQAPIAVDGDMRALARAVKIEWTRQVSKRGDCKAEHRQCKEKTRDRTKMFHVKHFGTEMARNRT